MYSELSGQLTETTTANSGLAQAGGVVLRMTVFRKFEHSCFVGSLVVKIPACAKPQTVTGNCHDHPTNHQHSDLDRLNAKDFSYF
jgi:hypothetical protein